MRSRLARVFILLACDLFLIVLASFLALLLRHNLEPTLEQTIAFLPYVAASLAIGVVIIPLLGLNRVIWRLSGMPDYLRVSTAAVLISLGATALTFGFNHMDQIARSLPILQGILVCFTMIGARVLFRAHHARRQRRRALAAQFKPAADPEVSHALVVGVSRLAEAYLQAVSDLAKGRVKVVGLLAEKPHQQGRLLQSIPVIGHPDKVDDVVRNLGLHGIDVDRIVIAMPFETLSADAQAELLRLERDSTIRLQFVGQDLDLEPVKDGAAEEALVAKDADINDVRWAARTASFVLDEHDIETIAQKSYWRLKRTIDVFGALALICLIIPLFPFVALVTALSVGLPVVFWQQRPGLCGQPFRLYKFRTMLAAHDANGRRIPDSQRLTRIGSFLRRTRLDELPQLFSILVGDMSFVGPRPLLPIDQPEAFRARLLVRPGLTGWAQVVGGRSIDAEDKAALDVWYVKNASAWLDTKIILKTIPMVLFGERTSTDLIKRSWMDLIDAGHLDDKLAYSARQRLGSST